MSQLQSTTQHTTRTVKFKWWQDLTLRNPFSHFALYAGVGSGKTFTGSHFSIGKFKQFPGGTGLIGANNYDQLSQATLKELFFWLDFYGYEYVVDRIPPVRWNTSRLFKSYKNILSVRIDGEVSYALTRTMSNPDPIRGVEISWYWLDELRDTEEYAHDMVLGRCRENDDVQGLVTTTTNGESWDYKRFVRSGRGQSLFGSMHVTSYEAVKAGIITQKYLDIMMKAYSPLMCLQEIEAKHVNVFGGKAYYSASERNALRRAPWGDNFPTRDRNLIVGCDFNFSPAPCAWIVGQIGPDQYGPNGEYWGECIHWFKEISGVGVSTPEMTLRLLSQFPDFFYEVYGDMSGNIGTTSNAGKTDFDQIGIELSNANAIYTISVEQMDESEAHINPRVRSRVENMNSLFLNAVGEVRQTYDPEGCPLFDGDIRMVGWKPTTQSGRGKLDDGGDKQRTHSTDGAGYAVFKKFPPGRRASIVESLPSRVREDL